MNIFLLASSWITRWGEDRDRNKAMRRKASGKVAWLQQLQCIVDLVGVRGGGGCLRKLHASCWDYIDTVLLSESDTVNTVVVADQCTHCNMLHCAPASPFGVKSFSCTVFCLPSVFNIGANANRLTHLTPMAPAGLIIRKKSTGVLIVGLDQLTHVVTGLGPCYEDWKERAEIYYLIFFLSSLSVLM